MESTTILPTSPTSGAVIQGGHGGHHGLSDLVLGNNIADNSRSVLTALHASVLTVLKSSEESKLEAVRARAELSRELSDIRSEQKEQASHTRELISRNETRRLEDEVNRLRLQISLGVTVPA